MLARVTLSFESSYKMGLIPLYLYSEANCSFWYFVLVELSIWPPSFCPRFQESPHLWIQLKHCSHKASYLYVEHFTEGMWQWREDCFITKSNSKALIMELERSLCWKVLFGHFSLVTFYGFPLSYYTLAPFPYLSLLLTLQAPILLNIFKFLSFYFFYWLLQNMPSYLLQRQSVKLFSWIGTAASLIWALDQVFKEQNFLLQHTWWYGTTVPIKLSQYRQ